MNICLFGAASGKIHSDYVTAIEHLGMEMARRGHVLVFGAGAKGLMGAAARGVHAAGGRMIGVIPTFFREERIEEIYLPCDEMIYTDSMRERKEKMEDLADGFITVPGGIGTFEEFFEVLTLKQLGRHEKPIALYNIDGYYDDLDSMLYHAMTKKFINSNCRSLYIPFTDEEDMFAYLERAKSNGMGVQDLKDGC